MKVRVTFDIDDDERMALGLATHGEFRMLTHEELAHWVNVSVAKDVKRAYDTYRVEADKMRQAILEQLGIDA